MVSDQKIVFTKIILILGILVDAAKCFIGVILLWLVSVNDQKARLVLIVFANYGGRTILVGASSNRKTAKVILRKLEEERIEKETEVRPSLMGVKEEKAIEGKAKIEEAVITTLMSPSEVNVGDIVVGIEIEDRGSLGNLRYLLALVPLTPECMFSISGKRLVLGQGELTISYDGPAKPEPAFNIVDKMDTMLRQLEVIKGEWVEFKATISGLKFKVEEEHIPLIKQIKGKVIVQRRKI